VCSEKIALIIACDDGASKKVMMKKMKNEKKKISPQPQGLSTTTN
jgi:hypothetical protein